MSATVEKVPDVGSDPSFLGRGVAFVDQTLDVDFAERDVSVLIDAGDGDRAGGDHGSSRQLALLFEILDHLVKRRRRECVRASSRRSNPPRGGRKPVCRRRTKSESFSSASALAPRL